MADVVQQRGELDVQLVGDAPREVVGAERVFESRVGCARIDQKSVTELADVAESLHRRRVDESESLGLEADVVPERVADDLELVHCGALRLTAGGPGIANGGGHAVGELLEILVEQSGKMRRL